jgi:DnaJ-domain-containing protein 1
MPLSPLQTLLTERLGPDGMRRAFYLVQLLIGGAFVAVLWRLRPGASSSESGFAIREADLKKARKPISGDDLAAARLERKAPLQLGGIRIDGTPHEILGVSPRATADEIQRAYRDRMKQYHPDKVGPPGSRQWNDAQKIAEAINRAKNELLKRPGQKS